MVGDGLAQGWVEANDAGDEHGLARGAGRGARQDPAQRLLTAAPGRRSPAVRQRLDRFYIEHEVKDITSFRVSNAEHNQRCTAFAIDATGAGGIAWPLGDHLTEARAQAFLWARANTIEGGTSEVLRNQIAERNLGLPCDVEVDREMPWQELRRA